MLHPTRALDAQEHGRCRMCCSHVLLIALKRILKGLSNVQLLPTGVHVSVAYPPDTDTPGYANENTTKACFVPGAPSVPLTTEFIASRCSIAESITDSVLGPAAFFAMIVYAWEIPLHIPRVQLFKGWQVRHDLTDVLGLCSLRSAMQSAEQRETSSTPQSRCCGCPVIPGTWSKC